MNPRFVVRSIFASKSRLARAAILATALPGLVHGYVLEGPKWPNGSSPTVQLELGSAGKTLSDGNTSWNSAVSPAIDMWNQVIAQVQLGRVMNSTAPIVSGDHINSISFGSTFFGQSFGSGTLAVTYYSYSGSTMAEADIVFNTAQPWDSYRGNLRSAFDVQRVALHELGHLLGMAHSTLSTAIMNAYINNSYLLTSDDIAGIQSLYGAPSSSPTPTPTPSATPTPTPSATPTPTPSATPTPTPSPVRVSLSVSPTSIQTGQTAVFTISASVPAANATTIRYSLSGNAALGKNYSLTGTRGQVTIAAGASSANVTLSVGKVGKLGKTATMTLNPGTGYTVSSPTSASVLMKK